MEQQALQVTLNVTINQLNTIISGIAKLPIEVGLEAFNVVQQQATQQLGQPSASVPQGPLGNKVIQ